MKKQNLKTNRENIIIRVETSYNKGGMNLWTYKDEKRGYYVHVTPIELERRDGYTMESVVAFSGYKRLYKEVSRASKKVEREADTNMIDTVRDLIYRVCGEQGLRLAEALD